MLNEEGRKLWLAAPSINSLLPVYGFDQNYYANYFWLFWGRKWFGLLGKEILGGRRGLDNILPGVFLVTPWAGPSALRSFGGLYTWACIDPERAGSSGTAGGLRPTLHDEAVKDGAPERRAAYAVARGAIPHPATMKPCRGWGTRGGSRENRQRQRRVQIRRFWLRQNDGVWG
jgi:hypothetical protein